MSKKRIKTIKIDGSDGGTQIFETISSKSDLKSFLENVRDKMTEDVAAPVYVLGAMNHALTLPQVYELFDDVNKEIARDIWLRLKQSGMQVHNPPLLFGFNAAEYSSTKQP